MAISLGGGGSASQINEIIYSNSTENLITLADGRVYLKGGVAETDTTTYPDATASMAYSNVSINFAPTIGSAVGKSITWDGTYFWVIGTTTDKAYAYNSSFVYQNKSFSFAGQETTPYGAGVQGSSVWVIGQNKTAYKYQNQIGISSNNIAVLGVGQNYVRIK